MSVQIQSLGSGSNGNCFLIHTNEGAVLIDVGISFRSLKSKLSRINVSLSDIKSVFISHAHIDHYQGLPVLLKHLPVPVIAAEQTIMHLLDFKSFSPVYDTLAEYSTPLVPNTIGKIGPFNYTTIKTSHDISGATAYMLQYAPEKINISVVTDTGILDEKAVNQLSKSDAILIESNYDKQSLKNSQRPAWLKQRIMKYHLSNDATAEILQNIQSTKLKAVMLGHLSGECNSPDQVRDWVTQWTKNYKPNWDWYLCPRDVSSNLLKVKKEEVISVQHYAGMIEC